jgi:4-amino-4-deoxy-L-arabinose transferase-like glycosyltransferase
VQRSAPLSERRPLALGLTGIALVTLWRVALLPFNGTDLFVDEAQYWFWGRELAWGYYSKPPLIGWILRLFTEIGSDSAFWIRLPLPLIHAATAIVLMLVARRLFDPVTGALAGLAYATLPAVALGSLLVSTDTPMLFCFALATLAWSHLTERRAAGWAFVLGAAIGIGLLAKYAMIYFPLTAALAALAVPRARISRRDAVIAATVALAAIAPNLVWNAANDFSTLRHTGENADWEGFRLNLGGLAEFVAGQFAIAGPVLFAAWIVALGRAGADWRLKWLACLSAPILAIVSFQALQSGANANWAAAAHLSVVIAGIAVLRGHGRLLALSFAIGLGISAALPVAAIFADTWRAGGPNLVLKRHVGQAAISLRAAEIARAENLDTIVSDSRSFLADLFYTLREDGLAIRAAPSEGFPPHHYAQKHPLTPGPGDVLYLARGDGPPLCRDGSAPREIARWRPETGYYTRDVFAFRVARSCWFGSGG